MGLLLPFDIKDKNVPQKCVVIPQFALKLDLLSLNFVVTPWIQSLIQTWKLNCF